MPIKVDSRFFLDSKKINRYISAKQRRVLNRAGAYARTVAKRSIKARKGNARAGEPPHSHTGLLKNFIFYSYDPRTKSVVVGPQQIAAGTAGALRALEHGGQVRPKQYKREKPRVGGFGIVEILGEANWYNGKTVKGTVRAFGKVYKVRYGHIYNTAVLRRCEDNDRKIFGDGGPVTVKPRPFMAPSLQVTIKELARFFEQS